MFFFYFSSSFFFCYRLLFSSVIHPLPELRNPRGNPFIPFILLLYKTTTLLCHNCIINFRRRFVFCKLAAYKVCSRDAYIFHWLDSVIGGRGLRALDFRGCSRSYVSRFWSAGTRDSVLFSFKIKPQSTAALSYTKPGIHSQGHPMAAAVLRDTCCVSRLKIKSAINTEMLNYKISCPFRWRHGLRRGSAPARLLKWRALIRSGAWLSVSCECCEVDFSASGWSPV